MKPAILLDSFSDIDFVEAEAIGVNLLLQTVEFGGTVWLEHTDLNYRELFERLDGGNPFPVASNLSVDGYSNVLERLLGRSSHVLALHPTNYLSNGLEVARKAAAAFPGRVTVIDGRTVSSGLALQAAWAARQFEQGREVADVARELRQLRRSQLTLVDMPTLQYLRTPIAESWRQQINPKAHVVVNGPGGDPTVVASSLAGLVGLKVMQQYLRRYARLVPGAHVTFFHTQAPDEVEELRALAQRLGFMVQWTVKPGLLYASQIGLGAYGFSILPEVLPREPI